jgi:hypothetical protein
LVHTETRQIQVLFFWFWVFLSARVYNTISRSFHIKSWLAYHKRTKEDNKDRSNLVSLN